jgi:hypothetical protein
MKSFYLVTLFAGSTAVFGYGGFVGYERLKAAHAAVVVNGGGEKMGTVAMVKNTVVEAVHGTRAPARDRLDIPGAPVSEDPVQEYDPKVLAELKQEGINLDDIAAIRSTMRTVLTNPDPEARMKAAMDLKARFGLTANPELLGRLESVDGMTAKVSWTEKGKRFVKSVCGSVYGSYLKMLGELDR